ncbi:nuclear transport factor 2 family protein [Saccharothrix xinjiangensis]|uniref:Nuclear transport factor 2 family protein n=1 Tax=Saccharothrix xinjiangensis TaxID=204798 RepID=A0ABV9Y7K2_9PSEU
MSRDFVQRVFEIVDARDAAGFAALFAPDGRIVFGNGAPMTGPDEVEVGVRAFFGTIAGLAHRVEREWQVGDDTVIDLVVTYRRLDGGEVVVPAAVIWTRDADGLFRDYRVYFDLAPLYA